ncbi:unnamed protein product [Caenorhabditis auriculariae]|uniref:Cyclin-dependent kinase inhibitor domain-containing protein n=1 Tax=Caenorhabditis auriculariae TaxID=2777116 RepID=A0A8S1HEN5_9PELO|nr:unnamed protein product [Caenorhabditis auriculariae]
MVGMTSDPHLEGSAWPTDRNLLTSVVLGVDLLSCHTRMSVVFPKSPKRSARRCLFGRPPQEETDAWLKEALRKIRQQDAEKYGFDFELGVPIESTSSEYVFEPCSENDVPPFYRTKVLPASTSPASSPQSQANTSAMSLTSCDDSDVSDVSMDSMEYSPVPPSRRSLGTPKKRQGKLTEFMAIRRKRLQRSPKSVDGDEHHRSSRRAVVRF